MGHAGLIPFGNLGIIPHKGYPNLVRKSDFRLRQTFFETPRKDFHLRKSQEVRITKKSYKSSKNLIRLLVCILWH